MIEYQELHGYKTILVNGVSQGVCDEYGKPESPYMNPIVKAIDELQEKSNVLFLGGGPMVLPSYAIRKGHNTTVYENNTEIIDVAKRFFDVPEALKIIIDDAKRFDQHGLGTFDLLVLDCYDGDRLDRDLYSVDFYSKIKNISNKICINYVCDDLKKTKKHAKELGTVFSFVKLYTLFKDYGCKYPYQTVYTCYG